MMVTMCGVAEPAEAVLGPALPRPRIAAAATGDPNPSDFSGVFGPRLQWGALSDAERLAVMDTPLRTGAPIAGHSKGRLSWINDGISVHARPREAM
jgi:hypothetical protein